MIKLTFFARFHGWTSAAAVAHSLNTTHFTGDRRVLIGIIGGNDTRRWALRSPVSRLGCVSNNLRSIPSIAHELGWHISVSLLANWRNCHHHLTWVHFAMACCRSEPSCRILRSSQLVIIFLRVINAWQQRLVPLIFKMHIILYSKHLSVLCSQKYFLNWLFISRSNLELADLKNVTYRWVVIVVDNFVFVLLLLLDLLLVFHDHHLSASSLVESLGSRVSRISIQNWVDLKFVPLVLSLTVEGPLWLVCASGTVDRSLCVAVRAEGLVTVFEYFLVLLQLQVLWVILR